MAPILIRRDDPSLLTLMEAIPLTAWRVLKTVFFIIGLLAFLFAFYLVCAGIIMVVGPLSTYYYRHWKKRYAQRRERKREEGEAAERAELEDLDRYVAGGVVLGGEMEGSVDGETLYDGEEEGKGVF